MLGPDISVGHVRNDVKNVIDTMGTNIPQPIESPRAETDTEESSYAAASYYSSIVQITEMAVPSDRGMFERPADSSAYSVFCGDSRMMSTPSAPAQYSANAGYLPQSNIPQACMYVLYSNKQDFNIGLFFRSNSEAASDPPTRVSLGGLVGYENE